MAKSISKELTPAQTTWLSENAFLNERVLAGIDVFPNEYDVKMLQDIATVFAPKLDTHVKGCQDCVNKLVKFVYESVKLNDK